MKIRTISRTQQTIRTSCRRFPYSIKSHKYLLKFIYFEPSANPHYPFENRRSLTFITVKDKYKQSLLQSELKQIAWKDHQFLANLLKWHYISGLFGSAPMCCQSSFIFLSHAHTRAMRQNARALCLNSTEMPRKSIISHVYTLL